MYATSSFISLVIVSMTFKQLGGLFPGNRADTRVVDQDFARRFLDHCVNWRVAYHDFATTRYQFKKDHEKYKSNQGSTRQTTAWNTVIAGSLICVGHGQFNSVVCLAAVPTGPLFAVGLCFGRSRRGLDVVQLQVVHVNSQLKQVVVAFGPEHKNNVTWLNNLLTMEWCTHI